MYSDNKNINNIQTIYNSNNNPNYLDQSSNIQIPENSNIYHIFTPEKYLDSNNVSYSKIFDQKTPVNKEYQDPQYKLHQASLNYQDQNLVNSNKNMKYSLNEPQSSSYKYPQSTSNLFQSNNFAQVTPRNHYQNEKYYQDSIVPQQYYGSPPTGSNNNQDNKLKYSKDPGNYASSLNEISSIPLNKYSNQQFSHNMLPTSSNNNNNNSLSHIHSYDLKKSRVSIEEIKVLKKDKSFIPQKTQSIKELAKSNIFSQEIIDVMSKTKDYILKESELINNDGTTKL